MTGTTTLGYPYPEDSDPVADLALAVRNLAQKVDDNIGVVATGTATVAMGGTANATVAVVFPVGRFTSAPAVATGSNHGNYDAYVESVTASGFTMRCKHRTDANTSVNVPVYWIAVQQ